MTVIWPELASVYICIYSLFPVCAFASVCDSALYDQLYT